MPPAVDQAASPACTPVSAPAYAPSRRRRAVGRAFAGGIPRLNSISDRLVHTFRMWAVEGTVVKTLDAATLRAQCEEVDMQDCRELPSRSCGRCYIGPTLLPPAKDPPLIRRSSSGIFRSPPPRFSARSLASRAVRANVVYRFFRPAPVQWLKYCSLDLGETSLVGHSDDRGYFRHLFCALKRASCPRRQLSRSTSRLTCGR